MNVVAHANRAGRRFEGRRSPRPRPIHEAFAQPAAPTLDSAVVVTKKPPEPIEELPPDVKPEGDNVVWLPGYWAFDSEARPISFGSAASGATFRRAVSGWRILDAGRHGFRWTPGYWSESTPQQTYYPPPAGSRRGRAPPAPNDDSFMSPDMDLPRHALHVAAGLLDRASPRLDVDAAALLVDTAGYIFVDGFGTTSSVVGASCSAPTYFGRGISRLEDRISHRNVIGVRPARASLFIRPTVGAYYFGDYYGPRYVGLGYTPWLDYRYRGRNVDPAWSYYAWQKPRHALVGNNRCERRTSPSARRRTGARATHQPPDAPKGNVQSVNLVMPLQQFAGQE